MVHFCFIVYLTGVICYFSLYTSGILCEDLYRHPSCQFNRLCTCLKPAPDMGTVACVNVPMTALPNFNWSRVNELRLENNGLRLLNKRNFDKTGIQNLQIKHNPITSIVEASFAGLENTLMQLDLTNNQLYSIPRQAIQSLSKLKYLDLSGNFIQQVRKEDFRGLERSLQDLLLSNNAVTEITQDVFGDLNGLESLDLSGNRLSFIYETSFRNGPPQLKNLDLSDNILDTLPYIPLRNLKSLQKINLSRNYITAISGLNENSDIPRPLSMTTINNGITLEELILDENHIEILPPIAFRYFARINRLSMNGNPMISISDDAFGGTEIREIFLRGCDLKDLSPTSFTSLSSHLELLDLSHNSLKERDVGAALENMTALVNVSLTGNDIHQLPANTFSNSSRMLQHLHLESVGKLRNTRSSIIHEDLQELENLRSLGLSQFPESALRGVEFAGVSSNLEKLTMKGSNLVHLSAKAFQHTPNIKHLDLSFNKLEKIDANAFQVMAYTLEYLDLSKALAKSVTHLPDKIFTNLSKLKELNLSNNRLKKIQQDLFVFLSELIFLNLQDNAIESFEMDTIHKNKHDKLERLKLSFNRIAQLGPNSFTGLQNLRYLYLDDNTIKNISTSTFADLDILQHLDLRGNRIENINNEAFQNLPRLTLLNIAHNSLKYFPLNIFNQVGSMSFLKVDVSYNNIESLTTNLTDNSFPTIKILDFSHNNISDIDQNYFQPLKILLEELYFSYNSLNRVTKSMFGEMMYLAALKLDHNHIARLDLDSFQNSDSLKVLILCNNRITVIQQELFSTTPQLQYLDISHNSLEELPDGLFQKTRQLQYLNLASNRLTRFPSTVLAPVASSLNHLDLSHNRIRHLTNDIFTNLVWLDLSFNDLKQIDNVSTFKKWAPRLNFLDVSNNLFSDALKAFSDGIGGQELVQINLSNTSLSMMPNLDLPNLKHLNLSRNTIVEINSRSLRNMTEIQEFDLSFNKLLMVPSTDIWKTVTRLRVLSLAHNSLNILPNESFTGLNILDELNIQGLSLDKLQSGVFLPLKNLQTLKINLYDHTALRSFDLIAAISPTVSLKSLHLFGSDAKTSNLVLKSNEPYKLPPKLTALTISGKSFYNFGKGALRLFRNRHLHLRFENVSADSLSLETFQSMNSVRFLQLDASGNTLVMMADPISAQLPGGRGIYLERLQMTGNRWQCDCGIGWIEHWMQQFRHINCQDKGLPVIYQKCQEVLENLRFTQCQNKGNKTLIDVLKDDLECEWKSSGFKISQQTPIGIAITVMTFHILLSNNN